MIVTKEWLDKVCPEHGRTSCSDDNLSNGYLRIIEEELKGVVVRRRLDPHPRCNRCFLLTNLNKELDPRLEIFITVSISLKQPNFIIKGVEDGNL